MKIWHIGASPSPQTVDGINTTIWLVAKEQALMGHEVTLLLVSPPDENAKRVAEEFNFQLIYIPTNSWSYDLKKLDPILRSSPPHIVHTHSVFLPNLATLARYLKWNKIPYIVTPNAISPQLLQRGWLKKKIYSWLVEKPRFYRASAISAVTPQEEKDIRAFVPNYKGVIRCVPNPVNPYLVEQKWKGYLEPKKLVYMGRFDVLHKGVDILVEIARSLPEDTEIHLYGNSNAKTDKLMQRLQSNLPSNVYFHPPVFGLQKSRVLAEASLYIQVSRWEVFGISVAEAMYLGVPCAIASTLNLAEIFNQYELGLVLPTDPRKAATCIAEILQQPSLLHRWSESARTYAKAYFHPTTVATSYLDLYTEALQP